jgi:hypothetical protein
VKAPKALFESTFVHAFEEDGSEGEVYRPEGDAVRRSRRPRERLSFSKDGTARLALARPDDRLSEVRARWTVEGADIVVTPEDAGGSSAVPLRVRLTPDGRLLVR